MSINQLIFRNLKKNLKNYYLYVFALIFSAALYFAFVTLQYDPSMDEVEGSIKGGAAIRAASVLLVGIISVFLLYANTIFIKRRSKEIGLFQLIGMTKSKIFRILTAENFILYFSSIAAGILLGFFFSKLIIMILYKITGVQAIASLRFSPEALLQTAIVFIAGYLLIMAMNYLYIKRQTILSLFRKTSSTEGKVKRTSVLEAVIGILGIGLIGAGYYVSSRLFEGDFTNMMALFMSMIFILASVIIGTYFFYKGSVRFLLNIMRRRKKGYMPVRDVLSLSSIMFRMKSNSLLLTIITTVSALALGLLSLSYISYYSAEKTAEYYVPNDFSFTNQESAETFQTALKEEGIPFELDTREVLQAYADFQDILLSETENAAFDSSRAVLPVVSDKSTDGPDLSPEEVYFTGMTDIQNRILPLKPEGEIAWKIGNQTIPQKYTGMEDPFIVSLNFTGGMPVAVVDEAVFQELKKNQDPAIKKDNNRYIGIDIPDAENLDAANVLFKTVAVKEYQVSQFQEAEGQKINMGLTMFIVGFLGLAFLISSGCILYFKQMDESEEEKPNYTILRKLGFTRDDLISGIRVKQLFNFGIPLILGLLHSYFAVQSGWFFFGAELWTPIIIVMVIYSGLYSIFGVLSVIYYRKVIKEAL
ncbi:FtsX-like permease family protein [Bacillus mangrovi]|uniref:FtsX-like permease family protein n=1 Tax=Metabacillus mangrovi TaxID=1491830 RepID=A0A7X2S749_9BACI|nr:ABC transporter permease [Metabacillus mangrovi]MTH54710.1 FtsX-like permease family protein [Metabacillus mangrovi]